MWDLIVSVPDHCLSFYFALCMAGVIFLYEFLIKLTFCGNLCNFSGFQSSSRAQEFGANSKERNCLERNCLLCY